MDLNLYNSVVSFVRRHNEASVSHIQRNFNLGYDRASEIMDKLENEHVVSLMSPGGRREVYPEIVANLKAEINELKAKLEVAQVKDGFVLVPKDVINVLKELTQLSSYAEIVGGISVNRSVIREQCDIAFNLIRELEDAEFAESIEAAQGEEK